MAKTFKITLKKSTIGQTKRQKDCVRCLGLRKTNSQVEVPDNPAMRGLIYKVQHLLNVEVVK